MVTFLVVDMAAAPLLLDSPRLVWQLLFRLAKARVAVIVTRKFCVAVLYCDADILCGSSLL